MAIPTFVGAGSGAERLTTGSVTVSKTGCTAGNLIIGHLAVDGTTGDWSGWDSAAATNIVTLNGGLSELEPLRTGGEFQISLGRVVADGTCSADVAVGASGEDIAARLYEFSGEFRGSTLAEVVENGGGTSDASAGTGTEIGDAPVTTNGADRLAVNFVWIESAQAMTSFAGESGGDWAEAVAEYVGTSLSLQLQVASMAAAGTINGGTFTVGGSTPWVSVGTAIIPELVVPVRSQHLDFDYSR